jgi:predicted GNAT family N-acyltransferase
MGMGLLIAVAVREQAERKRLLDQLKIMREREKLDERLKFASIQVESFAGQKLHEDVQAAEAAIQQFYAAGPSSVILISDSLVDEDRPAEVTLALIDQFASKPCGLIGITESGNRVAEIDRVIASGGSAASLRQAIEMVAARLHYISPPSPIERKLKCTVRRIAGEFELKKYFQLRHQIYSIMGYLDERKERAPSQMDIDASDATALHYGAFHRNKGYDTLVGTFRIVLTDQSSSAFSDWTRGLLDSDPQLRSLVHDESSIFTLRLPIFHSQQLDEQLQRSIQGNLLCAELSRVIVAHDFRGLGLSRLLVEQAKQEALQQRVHTFYLECLRIHEPMYGKHGFKTIQGKRGRVQGVNRTMIPMELEFATTSAGPEMAAAVERAPVEAAR